MLSSAKLYSNYNVDGPGRGAIVKFNACEKDRENSKIRRGTCTSTVNITIQHSLDRG